MDNRGWVKCMHAGAYLLREHLHKGKPIDLGDLEAVRLLDKLIDNSRPLENWE